MQSKETLQNCSLSVVPSIGGRIPAFYCQEWCSRRVWACMNAGICTVNGTVECLRFSAFEDGRCRYSPGNFVEYCGMKIEEENSVDAIDVVLKRVSSEKGASSF